MDNRRRNNYSRERKPENRINERIRVPEIRLVGDDVEPGIYKTSEALKITEGLGIDLVEVVPNANPPVCHAIDYNKFLYQKKKREKVVEKKNRENRVKLKEIKFTPNTDDNDVNHKLKKAIEFLSEGDKVKATVQFKGRMITHKEHGTKLLLKFAQSLEEHGVPESLPKMEGRRMIMVIKPKKGKG